MYALTYLENDVLLVDVLDRSDHVFRLALGKSDRSSTAAMDWAIALQLRDSAELLDVLRLYSSSTRRFGLFDSFGCSCNKVGSGSACKGMVSALSVTYTEDCVTHVAPRQRLVRGLFWGW
jgi:hypothetical protein